jgi:hypothetical protein
VKLDAPSTATKICAFRNSPVSLSMTTGTPFAGVINEQTDNGTQFTDNTPVSKLDAGEPSGDEPVFGSIRNFVCEADLRIMP